MPQPPSAPRPDAAAAPTATATRAAAAPAALRWPTPRELITLRCPLCHQAPMFRTPLHMHAACPACGHVFDRGNGYFLGAMLFSYALVVLWLAALVVALRLVDVSWRDSLIVGALTIPLVGPLVAFPYSRLWWVTVERRLLRDGQDRDAALRRELAARRRAAAGEAQRG